MDSFKSRYQQYLGSGINRRVALPLLVVIISTLSVFQNCAEPLESTNEGALSVADRLPFAFDVSVDHISYMSCSEMPANYPYRSFYTFRVGAYERAGIKFSEEFVNSTSKYKASERADFVSESMASADASIQLAIRQKKNYQSPLILEGTPRPSHDFETMLAPLDSPLLLQRLSELPYKARINYFSGISGLDNRQVEGSVRFTEDESLAKGVRNHLLNGALLTLTFTDQQAEDELVARGSTLYSTSNVYGRGYEIKFKKDGRGGALESDLRRSLSGITELDLTTSRGGAG
ncbi:hypothetical protein OAQ84_01425 [Bdellovibrionales bacterium]|nr:hypothetical protein [Bdellovibrionales bacterium]